MQSEKIDFLYDAGHIHMLMVSFMICTNKRYIGETVICIEPMAKIRFAMVFSTLKAKGGRYQMEMEMEMIIQEINNIKAAVSSLRQAGNDVPALDRNLQRISANIKMLELNFLDPEAYCQSK